MHTKKQNKNKKSRTPQDTSLILYTSFILNLISYLLNYSTLTVLTSPMGCVVAWNIPRVCACLCVSLRVKNSLFQLHNNKKSTKQQRATLLFNQGLVFCQTSYQHVSRWTSNNPLTLLSKKYPTYWHYLLRLPSLGKIKALPDYKPYTSGINLLSGKYTFTQGRSFNGPRMLSFFTLSEH